MTNEELFNQGKYNELYEQNQRYIYSLIKKFPNIDPEDIISTGNLGFAKAVASYTTDKNTKFLTYASRCIENEILMQFRKDKKHKGNVSLNETLNKDSDGNDLILEDVVTDDHDYEEDVLHSMELEQMKYAIICLPKVYQDVAWLYLDGLDQRQIARTLNLSQSYISRLERKLPVKLSKILRGNKYMKKRDEVFKMLDEGKDCMDIADMVSLSFRTVQTYKTAWYKSKGIIHEKGARADLKDKREENPIEDSPKSPKKYTSRGKPIHARHLKSTMFSGDVMQYSVQDSTVLIYRGAEDKVSLAKTDLKVFIEELQELLEVI